MENANATPSINANFAATVLNRAAELIADGASRSDLDGSVIGALQRARDEYLAGETHRQKQNRTYAWPLLLKDLGQYVKSREPTYAGSFSPIVEWSEATDAATVAQTLREAARALSRMVEERTRAADRFEAMTDQERVEYELMRKVAAFLAQHGLAVSVVWDRGGTNELIDYRATVDGEDWAFELTELRLDPKSYHRQVGHPKERKTIEQQLDRLEDPIPQLPDDPATLQRALDKAARHGNESSKLSALNGSKYCLVVHNRQFLDPSAWDEIAFPDFSPFDAVLILHQESFPPGLTWEVLGNGFGKPLRSNNVSDLHDIIGFRNFGRSGIDPEVIKSFWRRMEESGITDAEIRQIVKEVRADKCRRRD